MADTYHTNLKSLNLSGVDSREIDLHRLIQVCSNLEELHLDLRDKQLPIGTLITYNHSMKFLSVTGVILSREDYEVLQTAYPGATIEIDRRN